MGQVDLMSVGLSIQLVLIDLELEWTLGGVGREAQVDIYLRRLLKSKTPSDQSFVIVVPVEYFSDLSMWPHIIFPPRVIIIKIILIND